MRQLVLVVLLTLALVLPGKGECAASDVKLRGWFFGWQTASGQRNRYDVFGRDELPSGTVEDQGRGGGLLVGHRFGERFLVGFQLVFARHSIIGSQDHLIDAEALLTGTVIFRPKDTLQPFLRGGFGGASEVLELIEDSGNVVSYGTAAIAGGGFQIRLSSRFSLELETVATFSNYLEVYDNTDNKPWPEEKWQVRTSNYGWRVGLGVMVWF